MILLGGIGVGLGWILNAYADQLMWLYAGAAVSGIGAGGIYATCVGNAVKWFPDRRGLAVGLTAAGFGAGAALTVIPIRMLIAARRYGDAFLFFGIGQGIILILIAGILRGPDHMLMAPVAVMRRHNQRKQSFTSAQMLTSPIFWLMYVMFVLECRDRPDRDRAACPHRQGPRHRQQPPPARRNGAKRGAGGGQRAERHWARPFFGWVSSRLGRELTMGIAFALGAASYGLFGGGRTGGRWTFVVCAGLIFFTWGEIFSLFPSLCTDTFGQKYAAANASCLYTAKGTAALLVPFANVLQGATGSWGTVFIVAGISNVIVALLAVAVLRPLRRKIVAETEPRA